MNDWLIFLNKGLVFEVTQKMLNLTYLRYTDLKTSLAVHVHLNKRLSLIYTCTIFMCINNKLREMNMHATQTKYG